MIGFLIAALAIVFVVPVTASQPRYGLPAGAVVIETHTVPPRWRANRAIILWMVRPKKNPLRYGPEEYTCPDETRGSYYSGPTRVSLVDTQAGRVINTIRIKEEADEDSFDIPYKIRATYYEVGGVARGREGKPTILALQDFNGDGRPLEFALFDAVACMGLETALLGYSVRQDRVIQYPISLSANREGIRTQEVSTWIDYLFSKKPTTPRHWKYEIDYRGRNGTLDKYEIRYNAQVEKFAGTLDSKRE